MREFHERLRDYHKTINQALATGDDFEAVIVDLCVELAELSTFPGPDPLIQDDVGMLLDAARLALATDLSLRHFGIL